MPKNPLNPNEIETQIARGIAELDVIDHYTDSESGDVRPLPKPSVSNATAAFPKEKTICGC